MKQMYADSISKVDVNMGKTATMNIHQRAVSTRKGDAVGEPSASSPTSKQDEELLTEDKQQIESMMIEMDVKVAETKEEGTVTSKST